MVAVVVVAFDGGFFDGSVPAFDLFVGPGMVGLGERFVTHSCLAAAIILLQL